MIETIQHVVVTIVALAAAVFVFRRVFVTLRPARRDARCASCPSAGAQSSERPSETPAPLKLIR